MNFEAESFKPDDTCCEQLQKHSTKKACPFGDYTNALLWKKEIRVQEKK